MKIPLLLIGTAYDGPRDQIVQPTSIEEAFNLFGGYAYESVDIDATSTSFSLGGSDVTGLEMLYWRDGDLNTFEEITGVVVNGTSVSHERVGRSVNLIAKYVRPFDSEASLVYKGFAEAFSTAGGDIYVMRVGGTHATCSLGPVLTFDSEFSGALYNTGTITSDGSKLTITLPAGKGDARIYDLTDKTYEQLAYDINLDFQKGYSCYKVTQCGTGAVSIAAGSWTFSGGTDGELTDELINQTLQSIDLRGVKTVCILGKLHRCHVTDADTLSSIYTPDNIENLPYPTMFVSGVAYDDSLTDVAYANSVIASKTIAATNVTLACGQCRYSYAPVPTYWASIAPIYAAVMARENSGCTYQVTGAPALRPLFTEDTLDALLDTGFANFTVSASKGSVVYSDRSSNTEWDSTYQQCYLSVVEAVYPIVDSIPGRAPSDTVTLQNELESVLSSIPGLKDYDVNLTRPAAWSISIQITLFPYGKTRSIQFGVIVNATTPRYSD